jgi:hypothetical protein
VTDARRRCQLDLFEFLLEILLTYSLSLALWMRSRVGLWKIFNKNAFATHLHMQVDAHVSAQNLESIKVHQPGIEAAWGTTAQLRKAAELVV